MACKGLTNTVTRYDLSSRWNTSLYHLILPIQAGKS